MMRDCLQSFFPFPKNAKHGIACLTRLQYIPTTRCSKYPILHPAGTNAFAEVFGVAKNFQESNAHYKTTVGTLAMPTFRLDWKVVKIAYQQNTLKKYVR